MPDATRLRDQTATRRHLGQTHPPICQQALTVCNECTDSCDIRVVTPDLGDADDEPKPLRE
jgi:hypothetical protein